MMDRKAALLVIGVSLLVLGGVLVYVSESRHLDSRLYEVSERQLYFGWGLVSVVVGAGVLTGGLAIKRKP